MGADIHSIETGPSDTDRAKQFAVRMGVQLEMLCNLENEAAAAGFAFNYGIGFNAFGQKCLQYLKVLKALA